MNALTETFILDGKELPVWNFTTWAEMDNFFETLAPDAYYPTFDKSRAEREDIWGVVHSEEPEGYDVHADNSKAIAVYRITNPEQAEPAQ